MSTTLDDFSKLLALKNARIEQVSGRYSAIIDDVLREGRRNAMQPAAQRLSEAFRGSHEALQSWLNLVLVNAKTTMAMLFQDPSTQDPRLAAENSANILLDNARKLSEEAQLEPVQAAQFMSVHQQAINEFTAALDTALNRAAKDRSSQALLISHILRLPVGPIESVDEETWFELLDEVDEAARRRRARIAEPDAPKGTNRDQIAEWIAKKHFAADIAVREIWYLKNANPADIYLLEVNDRLSTANGNIEPIDFGLNIDGANFRLFVADITSEELEAINNNNKALPLDWSLKSATVWRRRT